MLSPGQKVVFAWENPQYELDPGEIYTVESVYLGGEGVLLKGKEKPSGYSGWAANLFIPYEPPAYRPEPLAQEMIDDYLKEGDHV